MALLGILILIVLVVGPWRILKGMFKLGCAALVGAFLFVALVILVVLAGNH